VTVAFEKLYELEKNNRGKFAILFTKLAALIENKGVSLREIHWSPNFTRSHFKYYISGRGMKAMLEVLTKSKLNSIAKLFRNLAKLQPRHRSPAGSI
jgi:hypothetical protein